MKFLDRLQLNSYAKDLETFRSLVEKNPEAKLLDVGCGNGELTELFTSCAGIRDITGLDVQYHSLPWKFVQGNLEEGMLLPGHSFDAVISYHVIEHISHTDLFVKEIYRVLKVGGYALIGTPNLASGRVILELLLNKQPNTAHVSDYFILRGDPGEEWRKSVGYLHRRLFTIEGLCRLLEYYSFQVELSKGTGYGILPLNLLLKGRYAADIIVKARKV